MNGWRDNGLVFCNPDGTKLKGAMVQREFRRITKAAGIGVEWTPREPRHSFVSITSDGGVSLESIADLCGQANPGVTGSMYRHQLKPVITEGGRDQQVFGDPKGRAKRKRAKKSA